jgi:hypothetical protein
MCDGFARRSLFLRAEPGDRYAFTHALIQEVCAERSSPVRRQRWHRLIAEALERDPRAGELSHLLAKHFDAAGNRARAMDAYMAASRQAAQRYASSDAVTLCARALDLLPGLAASRERDLLELEILGAMCQQVNSSSFSAAFTGREPLAIYTRAIEIARSLGDPAQLYATITQLCNYKMITAQYDHTAELTSELEQLERAHDLDPVRLHAGIFARAYIAFFKADFGTALGLLERLTDEAPFCENLPGRALALGHLACVRWVVGEPERALDEALATIELADVVKIPILQALAHVVRGRLRFLRRDPLPIVEEESLHAVRAAALDLGLLTEANAFALWAGAQRGPLELAAIEPKFGAKESLMETRFSDGGPGSFKLSYQSKGESPQTYHQRMPRTDTVFDGHSVIGALRGWRGRRGQTAYFYILAGKVLWQNNVKYAGTESINTAFGTVRARRFDGVGWQVSRFLKRNHLKKTRRYTLYLTDDDKRLPLLVVARTEYGDVRAELMDFQSPLFTITRR